MSAATGSSISSDTTSSIEHASVYHLYERGLVSFPSRGRPSQANVKLLFRRYFLPDVCLTDISTVLRTTIPPRSSTDTACSQASPECLDVTKCTQSYTEKKHLFKRTASPQHPFPEYTFAAIKSPSVHSTEYDSCVQLSDAMAIESASVATVAKDCLPQQQTSATALNSGNSMTALSLKGNNAALLQQMLVDTKSIEAGVAAALSKSDTQNEKIVKSEETTGDTSKDMDGSNSQGNNTMNKKPIKEEEDLLALCQEANISVEHSLDTPSPVGLYANASLTSAKQTTDQSSDSSQMKPRHNRQPQTKCLYSENNHELKRLRLRQKSMNRYHISRADHLSQKGKIKKKGRCFLSAIQKAYEKRRAFKHNRYFNLNRKQDDRSSLASGKNVTVRFESGTYIKKIDKFGSKSLMEKPTKPMRKRKGPSTHDQGDAKRFEPDMRSVSVRKALVSQLQKVDSLLWDTFREERTVEQPGTHPLQPPEPHINERMDNGIEDPDVNDSVQRNRSPSKAINNETSDNRNAMDSSDAQAHSMNDKNTPVDTEATSGLASWHIPQPPTSDQQSAVTSPDEPVAMETSPKAMTSPHPGSESPEMPPAGDAKSKPKPKKNKKGQKGNKRQERTEGVVESSRLMMEFTNHNWLLNKYQMNSPDGGGDRQGASGVTSGCLSNSAPTSPTNKKATHTASSPRKSKDNGTASALSCKTPTDTCPPLAKKPHLISIKSLEFEQSMDPLTCIKKAQLSPVNIIPKDSDDPESLVIDETKPSPESKKTIDGLSLLEATIEASVEAKVEVKKEVCDAFEDMKQEPRGMQINVKQEESNDKKEPLCFIESSVSLAKTAHSNTSNKADNSTGNLKQMDTKSGFVSTESQANHTHSSANPITHDMPFNKAVAKLKPILPKIHIFPKPKPMPNESKSMFYGTHEPHLLTSHPDGQALKGTAEQSNSFGDSGAENQRKSRPQAHVPPVTFARKPSTRRPCESEQAMDLSRPMNMRKRGRSNSCDLDTVLERRFGDVDSDIMNNRTQGEEASATLEEKTEMEKIRQEYIKVKQMVLDLENIERTQKSEQELLKAKKMGAAKEMKRIQELCLSYIQTFKSKPNETNDKEDSKTRVSETIPEDVLSRDNTELLRVQVKEETNSNEDNEQLRDTTQTEGLTADRAHTINDKPSTDKKNINHESVNDTNDGVSRSNIASTEGAPKRPDSSSTHPSPSPSPSTNSPAADVNKISEASAKRDAHRKCNRVQFVIDCTPPPAHEESTIDYNALSNINCIFTDRGVNKETLPEEGSSIPMFQIHHKHKSEPEVAKESVEPPLDLAVRRNSEEQSELVRLLAAPHIVKSSGKQSKQKDIHNARESSKDNGAINIKPASKDQAVAEQRKCVSQNTNKAHSEKGETRHKRTADDVYEVIVLSDQPEAGKAAVKPGQSSDDKNRVPNKFMSHPVANVHVNRQEYTRDKPALIPDQHKPSFDNEQSRKVSRMGQPFSPNPVAYVTPNVARDDRSSQQRQLEIAKRPRELTKPRESEDRIPDLTPMPQHNRDHPHKLVPSSQSGGHRYDEPMQAPKPQRLNEAVDHVSKITVYDNRSGTSKTAPGSQDHTGQPSRPKSIESDRQHQNRDMPYQRKMLSPDKRSNVMVAQKPEYYPSTQTVQHVDYQIRMGVESTEKKWAPPNRVVSQDHATRHNNDIQAQMIHQKPTESHIVHTTQRHHPNPEAIKANIPRTVSSPDYPEQQRMQQNNPNETPQRYAHPVGASSAYRTTPPASHGYPQKTLPARPQPSYRMPGMSPIRPQVAEHQAVMQPRYVRPSAPPPPVKQNRVTYSQKPTHLSQPYWPAGHGPSYSAAQRQYMGHRMHRAYEQDVKQPNPMRHNVAAPPTRHMDPRHDYTEPQSAYYSHSRRPSNENVQHNAHSQEAPYPSTHHKMPPTERQTPLKPAAQSYVHDMPNRGQYERPAERSPHDGQPGIPHQRSSAFQHVSNQMQRPSVNKGPPMHQPHPRSNSISENPYDLSPRMHSVRNTPGSTASNPSPSFTRQSPGAYPSPSHSNTSSSSIRRQSEEAYSGPAHSHPSPSSVPRQSPGAVYPDSAHYNPASSPTKQPPGAFRTNAHSDTMGPRQSPSSYPHPAYPNPNSRSPGAYSNPNSSTVHHQAQQKTTNPYNQSGYPIRSPAHTPPTKSPASADAETRPSVPPLVTQFRCHADKCRREAGFVCSGCHKVAYCSSECQVKDWNSHSGTCTGDDSN